MRRHRDETPVSCYKILGKKKILVETIELRQQSVVLSELFLSFFRYFLTEGKNARSKSEFLKYGEC